MNRDLNLQQKIAKLITNCFHNVDENIIGTVRINHEDNETLKEQIIGLMQYFENEKLYVLDLPVNLIPHPEIRRRMVDPELINVPANKPTLTETEGFNTFYDLTIKIGEHLYNNREVFLYRIDRVVIYNPVSFEPNYRYMLRYCVIDMDYWYNADYVITQENYPLQPGQYFESYHNTPKKPNKPKSVGNSKLIHKFNGDT